MDEASGSTALSFKVIAHLSKILARTQGANKTESKELEKDLSLLGQADAEALVEAGTLELLLRYLAVDQHFDVIAKCLMALSAYDTARASLYDMQQSGVAHLAKSMFNQSRGAKGEKQIDRASALAKILVLYSIDAPADQLTWLPQLCDLLVDSLEKATTKAGQQEAYVYLSVVLPAMWVSMGSSLAPIIASHIIDSGGMPLLLKVAKEVQRSDIKGLPKIIAEKALNLLCACNSEQPELSLQHVDVGELANFCVETTMKSDWVQSQELSLVLLGRLVFLQHALSEAYLETDPVVKMIQHALETKSPALRMTALCLALICSETLFEHVCVEANKVIMELGQGSYQSVKRLSGTTAGGMTVLRWGQGINKFAADLLKGSTLLARMAETVPAHLPTQLVELLTPDLKTYVCGIKAAHGVKDSPVKNSRHIGPEVEDPYGEEEPLEPPMPVQAAPARKPLATANAGASNGAALPRSMANGHSGGGGRMVASNVKQILGQQPISPNTQLPLPQNGAGQVYGTVVDHAGPGGGGAQKRPRQQDGLEAEDEGDYGADDASKRTKPQVAPKATGPPGATPLVHNHMASMMAAAQRPGAGAPPAPAPASLAAQPMQSHAPLPVPQNRPANVAMLTAQSALVSAQATLAKVRQASQGTDMPMNAQGMAGIPQKLQQPGAMPNRAAVPKAPPAASTQQPAHMAHQQAPAQAPATRGSGGGATTSGGTSGDGSKAFSSMDLSQLNSLLFELMMQAQADQFPDKAHTVLNQLMAAMEKVGKLMPLKHKLPATAAVECETMLRNWAGRVRQMGGALPHAQGPALEMLFNFSNMMVEEVSAYLDDADRQTQA